MPASGIGSGYRSAEPCTSSWRWHPSKKPERWEQLRVCPATWWTTKLAQLTPQWATPSRAIKALKDAADGGFLQTDRLQNDTEWNPLRAEPQFVALANEVKHNAAPCEDAEFRQFDFWVGDWDVISTADGVSRGSSHISKEMGGCVIWENWTSAGSSYFGKSYNTYNLNLHRWEQYWVDNSAGTIFFFGNLKDGLMDYWTDDIPQPNGQKLRRHLQFFNLGAGKVRQFSQGSTDGGKTWQVEYDLTYNRHADKSAGAP